MSGGSRGIGLAIGIAVGRLGGNVVLLAKSDRPAPGLPGTIHTAAAEIERCRRTSGCPDRSPSRPPSTAAGRRRPRPARSAPAGSRRSRDGRPVRPPPGLPPPPPSAPPDPRQKARPGFSCPAMGLRDFNRAHRRREVGAGGEPVPDLVQIVLQIGLELRDFHRVHAGCALVRLDFLPRLPDSPLRDIERLARCFQLVHAIPPGALPVDRTNQATNDPAPSHPLPLQGLHRYYEPVRQRVPRRYSAPCGSAARGTPCRTAPRGGPASIGTRLLLFRVEAADRARVVYMPDATWPVSGYPPGSSRSRRNTPVPMSSEGFGTSATIRSRSPSRSPPDASTGAFPLIAHHDGLQPTQHEAA
jgi:hypothetical protein